MSWNIPWKQIAQFSGLTTGISLLPSLGILYTMLGAIVLGTGLIVKHNLGYRLNAREKACIDQGTLVFLTSASVLSARELLENPYDTQAANTFILSNAWHLIFLYGQHVSNNLPEQILTPTDRSPRRDNRPS